MTKRMWVVTLTVPEQLQEVRYLTAQEALTTLLTQLLNKYPDYSLRDSILIKPTDMAYYE
jgi:hypothetical protein